MKSALKLLSVLAVVLLFSAWAAPLLFKILPFEYERIMNRLIVLLSFLTIYMMYIRGHEKELIFFGFKGTDKSKWFSTGFVYGLVIVVFIVFIEMVLRARRLEINFHKSGPIVSMGQALSTGLAVGIFEEWFFRGFLLKSFRRGLSLNWAIFWMNVLYAFSHFIEVGNLKGGAQASFINSLKLMAGFFSQFREPAPVFMEIAGLFIFGYLVTWALLKTGSLYMSMGIHAGVVAAIKIHDRLVQPQSVPVWFFGNDKYYNGVLGWICLLFSGYILVKLIDRLPWPRQAPLLSVER